MGNCFITIMYQIPMQSVVFLQLCDILEVAIIHKKIWRTNLSTSEYESNKT